MLKSLSSVEINNLVAKYRLGDVVAAEQLLLCFEPMMGGYLNVLFHGKFNKNNRNICNFLELCGKIDIENTANIIKVKLRRYPASELVSIVKVALLTTAKQCDNITASFGFVLFKYLKAMLWEDHIEDIVIAEDKIVYYLEKNDVPIDASWLSGDTAGPGFSELTKYQREIIKLCWYDNIPDIHVATRLKITLYKLSKEKVNIKNLLASLLGIKESKK